MRNLNNKVILDGKNRKLFFVGSCLEVREHCKALCCRGWKMNISYDEFKSGLYKADIFCRLNKAACENPQVSCLNREYPLKKKEDGSCIYLSADNKCTIYKNRPKVCKDFSCKGGWLLYSVAPYAKNKILKTWRTEPGIDKTMLQKLKFDMHFIINPLIELKSVFYLKERNELLFREKTIHRCNIASFCIKFNNPELDDSSINYLIKLFNGRNDLYDVYRSVKKKYNLSLSRDGFLEIVDLLFLNRILAFKCVK